MDLKNLTEQSEHAATLLKSLANEKRLAIVCILTKGEKNVGELEQQVGLSQSALSQHLARLRRDGVVGTRREAQTIFYSIRCEKTLKLLHCLCGIYDEMCKDG